MDETIALRVNVTVDVEDAATGKLLRRDRIHNLVVSAGLALIASWLAGSAPTAPSHLALGTSSTAASAGQTTLVAEAYRAALTTATVSGSVATFKYFLPASLGNGSTYAEVGIFNHASVGTMLARAVLAATIAKTSSVQVTFTWDVTLAAVA
jgi:hypothetical protein